MFSDPDQPAPSSASAEHDAHDAEFMSELVVLFEERITFNRTLGLKVAHAHDDGARCTLRMRPELVGHFAYNRMHGGVISAVLDATGGLAVMAAMGARHRDKSVQWRMQRFAKLGTIDLRVDYLRPAVGPHFVASAQVTRLGARVATTQMTFSAEDDTVLSTGAAVYIVS